MLKTKLWKHQEEGVEFALARKGAMLAFEMGCGKTATALAIAERIGAQKILISTPLSVVRVWPREIERHLSPGIVSCALDRGSVASKADTARHLLALSDVRREPCAVIVNHESLWRPPFSNLALRTRWDLVIIDESHRAKSPGGKLSRFLRDLRHVSRNVLGLTGTPMPHSLMDVYAQARFLCPEVYGTSFVRFRARYAVMGGFQKCQIIGYQNEREAMERFSSFAIQAKKQDVLDLPEEVHTERVVELEPKARRAYESLARNFWAAVATGEVTASNAMVKLLRLQQLTGGWLPLDPVDGEGKGKAELVSTAKEEALRDLLEDLGEPAVVFCRFRRDLDTVQQTAEALGLSYGEVSGRRKDLVEAQMPEVDVLGVQIQSGGVGIDLSRAATVVFYSTGFSLGDYLQACSRVHRHGQNRRVTYVHLIAANSIDVEVYRALQNREKVIESLLARARVAPSTRLGG